MALSPWPTSPAAEAAATATLKEVLGDDLSDSRVSALGAAAGAQVERYAPDAPQSVKDEAVIRTAAWLLEAPASGLRSEKVGDIEATYTPSMTGPLRASAAMGLLAPWKIRRAGSIG